MNIDELIRHGYFFAIAALEKVHPEAVSYNPFYRKEESMAVRLCFECYYADGSSRTYETPMFKDWSLINAQYASRN